MYQEFSVIYEKKIKEDFDYQAMAGFVRRAMKDHGVPRGHLLDMGCGTGNAGFELRKDFHELVLCDPSEEMLVLARGKFTPPYLPRFILGKAEDFRMPERFDLILSILDVPNYLDPQGLQSYLENSWMNLKAGGLLIFDISSPFKLMKMAEDRTYIYDEDDYFHVWENQLEEDRLRMEINLFVKSGEDGSAKEPLFRRITERQSMQIITKEEIVQRVQPLGFTVAGVHDGYSQDPIKADSHRMVFVLKKEKKQQWID